MNKQQHEQLRKYQRDKLVFLQMDLEQNIKGVTHQIEKYSITDETVPSSLLFELEPLQQRINTLVQQLKSMEQ